MNPQQPDAHRAAPDARPPTMTDVAEHAVVTGLRELLSRQSARTDVAR